MLIVGIKAQQNSLRQGNLRAVINRFQLLRHFIWNVFTHGCLALRSGNQGQRRLNNCTLLIINLTNQNGTKNNANDTLNHLRSYCMTLRADFCPLLHSLFCFLIVRWCFVRSYNIWLNHLNQHLTDLSWIMALFFFRSPLQQNLYLFHFQRSLHQWFSFSSIFLFIIVKLLWNIKRYINKGHLTIWPKWLKG